MSFRKIQLINPWDIGCPDTGHIYFGRNDVGLWEKFDDCTWHYITTGSTSAAGTSGSSGQDGTSGVNGDFFGSSGTSGTSGLSGTSGSSGTSGKSGTSGTSGSSGTSGTSGLTGSSGTSGLTGSSGTSGLTGTSGSSGVDGTFYGSSGTSGSSGISGYGAATRRWIYTTGSTPTEIGYFTSVGSSLDLNDINGIKINWEDADGQLVSGWIEKWVDTSALLKIEEWGNSSVFGIYSITPGSTTKNLIIPYYVISGFTLFSADGILVDEKEYLISHIASGGGTSGESGSSGTSGMGVMYQNPDPTLATNLEGFPYGSTYQATGRTVQEMWDALLYPYQYPTFSSFYFQSENFDHEAGQAFASLDNIALWTTTNSSNVSGGTIEISGYNLTTLTGLDNTLSQAITFTSIVNISGSGYKTWYINGKNTLGTNMTQRSYSIYWKKKLYWGNSSDTHLTNYSGLTSSQSWLTSSVNKDYYDFVGGYYKYWFFDQEQTHSNPIVFKDKLTGFGIAMEASYSVTITNLYGISCTYDVYRSTEILGGDINIIVS